MRIDPVGQAARRGPPGYDRDFTTLGMKMLPGCYRDNRYYQCPVSAWEAH